MRPRRTATRTASVPVGAPSLPSGAATWNFTVWSLMPRRAAIALLHQPVGEELEDLQFARSQRLFDGLLRPRRASWASARTPTAARRRGHRPASLVRVPAELTGDVDSDESKSFARSASRARAGPRTRMGNNRRVAMLAHYSSPCDPLLRPPADVESRAPPPRSRGAEGERCEVTDARPHRGGAPRLRWRSSVSGITRDQRKRAPIFEVDPFWPKPLPNHWVTGSTIWSGVDAQDNVWTIHRPAAASIQFQGRRHHGWRRRMG